MRYNNRTIDNFLFQLDCYKADEEMYRACGQEAEAQLAHARWEEHNELFGQLLNEIATGKARQVR